MASPPITIGELTDVPAPKSRVLSPWAQEVTNRIVHRFADGTALAAWTPADGALAWVVNSKTMWQRIGGAWVSPTPRGLLAVRRGTGSTFSTQSVTAVDFTVTAGQTPQITFTPDPLRTYRFHFASPFSLSITARAYVQLFGGGTLLRANPLLVAAGGANTSRTDEWIVSGLAAASTLFKVMTLVDNASAVLNYAAASNTSPIEFSVEDIGLTTPP